ncbi:MAG: Uma2 family endonuclease [Bacteroidota bacterium]
MKEMVELEKDYTVLEYLELEKYSTIRHEYYHGKLIPIPGTTLQHNKRAKNIAKLLDEKLNNNGWETYCLEVKVQAAVNIFSYPDVVLVKKQEQDMQSYFVTNPFLIVEILSDTTRKYDFTDKFIQYSKIDTLNYYLLVEPDKQVVFLYERTTGGDWVSHTYTELFEEIKLGLLNTKISLAEIYK